MSANRTQVGGTHYASKAIQPWEPRTTEERYMSATDSSHLEMSSGACDVDVMIAAGWAGSMSPLRDAVMRLRRIEQSGHTSGMGFVVEVLDLWLKSEAPVRSWKTAGKDCPDKIIRPVISWWLHPACHHCNGLGFHLIPGTPVIDTNARCTHCVGGTRRLSSVVESKYLKPAEALADRLDETSWVLFGDMAKLLRYSDSQSVAQ